MAPSAPKPIFAPKDKIICVDPKYPTVAYKSEVVCIQMYDGSLHYRVHFDGWNKRTDLYVALGDEKDCMYATQDLAAVQKIIDEKNGHDEDGPPPPKKASKGGKKSGGGKAAGTPKATATPKAAAATPTTSATAATPKTSATAPKAAAATPKTSATASKAAAAPKSADTPKATPKTKAVAKAQSKTVGKSATPKPVAKTPTAKTPTPSTVATARRSKIVVAVPKTAERKTPSRRTPASTRRTRSESEHSEELGEVSSDEEEEQDKMEVDGEAPEAPGAPKQAPEVGDTTTTAEEEEEEEEEQEDVEMEEEEGDEDSEDVEEAEEDEDGEISIVLPTRHVDLSDVTLHIPPQIRQTLIDDCSLVHIGYLSKVPAAVSIDEIVKRYERHICPGGYIEEDWSKIFIECKEPISQHTKFPEALYILAARSMADYFNGTPSTLLYRRERKQFRRLVIDECAKAGVPVPDQTKLRDAGFRPSAHYGYQHLIRTIATIPDYMVQQAWNEHMMETLLHGFHHFVQWLEKNIDKFYPREAAYIVNDLDDQHVPTFASLTAKTKTPLTARP